MSEAASLALHAMAFLASGADKRLPAGEIASRLHVSEAHLAKVLQRLGKVGLVKSTRGRNGGFVLGKPSDQVTLLDVYEAIEGPLSTSNCLLGLQTCGARRCILGGLTGSVNARVRDYLAQMPLSKLSDIFQPAA